MQMSRPAEPRRNRTNPAAQVRTHDLACIDSLGYGDGRTRHIEGRVAPSLPHKSGERPSAGVLTDDLPLVIDAKRQSRDRPGKCDGSVAPPLSKKPKAPPLPAFHPTICPPLLMPDATVVVAPGAVMVV